MLGKAPDNRCEELIHLCFSIIMFSTVPGLKVKHVLACPTLAIYPPPSFLGQRSLMLPLEPTLDHQEQHCLFLKFPDCLSAFSSLSFTHTGTRLLLTNPHPSHHKKLKAPCAPSTSSWHLVQTMLTQPPP